MRSDRRKFRPYGLYGGEPGQPSWNWLDPDDNPEPVPSKLTLTIRQGQLFRHEVAGAGGYGDPLERDPDAVARDVRNELVSPAAARADYGVVIDGRRARPRGERAAARASCAPRAAGPSRRCPR